MNETRQIIIDEFGFFKDIGYALMKDTLEEKIQLLVLKIIYFHNEYQKEITISVSFDQSLNNEFFITSSIVNDPYISVNDFVSFDVYLRKAVNIVTDTTIKFDNGLIDLMTIKENVTSYANLFKKHGIKLIDNKEKFSGYFPEWT